MKGNLVFIGAGNMAEALVKGIVERDVWPAGRVIVTDVRPEQLDRFRATYRVHATANNLEAAAKADVIVLAVKPQMMGDVLAELKGNLPAKALVVSIAAGTTSAKIEAGLGGDVRVVRVMPNTPALVGAGASAICGGKHAASSDLDLVETLFAAVGTCARVTEDQMDAVTALSGSGPAYVFYLMEALLEAGAKMGLSPEVAKNLAFKTIEGAAKLATTSDVGPAELRARVTSKGGTTAAAVDVLDKSDAKRIWVDAVLAAQRRGRELSQA